MSLKWGLSRLILYTIFRVLFGFTIKGSKNVPRDGGGLLCANHRSSWDPPFVGVASPREVFFIAKEELFTQNRPFSWLIRQYHAIPIKRKAGGYGALKISMDLLKNEKLIVVFPEGTRNRTEKDFLPFKNGAALLAQRSGKPMIPTLVKNSHKKLWEWLSRKASPAVYFGKPIFPERYPPGKEGITRMTRDLESAIRKLAIS